MGSANKSIAHRTKSSIAKRSIQLIFTIRYCFCTFHMTEACKVRLENSMTYSERDQLHICNAFFAINKECFNQNFCDIIYRIGLSKSI